MTKTLGIILAIALAPILVSVGALYWSDDIKRYLFGEVLQISPTSCSLATKLCPDGSSVGRIGPNCEFAPCPEVKSEMDTSSWKTYRNEKYGFGVKYPNDWSVEVKEFPDSTFVDFKRSTEDFLIGINIAKDPLSGDKSAREKRNEYFIRQNNIRVGDFNVVKVTYRNPHLPYEYYSYVVNDHGPYSFLFRGGGDPEYDEIFQTIFNSLKFN